MKRFLQRRVLPLLCCLSLTVGLFSYQPPKAKAVAVADDLLITGVILAVMAYGGYTISINNMDIPHLSDILRPHLEKFNSKNGTSAENPFSGFAEWASNSVENFKNNILFFPGSGSSGEPDETTKQVAGFTMSALLFEKICDFVSWLGNELGVKSGGESVPVVSVPGAYRLYLADGDFIALGSYLSENSGFVRYTPGSVLFDVVPDMRHNPSNYSWKYTLSNGFQVNLYIGNVLSPVVACELYGSDGTYLGGSRSDSAAGPILISSSGMRYDKVGLAIAEDGNSIIPIFRSCQEDWHYGEWQGISTYPWFPNFTVEKLSLASSPASSAEIALPGEFSPKVPADETAPIPMEFPNASPDVSSLEDLLQDILGQLKTNNLEVKPSEAEQPTPDPGTDTDPAGLGLFGWLKRIWESIIALPAQIAQAIHDLFIPHEGYATEFVSSINGIFEDRMGLLTYPLSVLSDFVSTVATLDEQEPILRWNDVVWQNKTIIRKGEYNLKSALSGTAMQSAYSVYRTVVSAVLVIAFLHLLLKKLKEVQSN